MDYSTFEANTILNNPVTEKTWLQFHTQKLTDSFAANKNQIPYSVYPRFDGVDECMSRGEKKWECVGKGGEVPSRSQAQGNSVKMERLPDT